MQAIRNTMSRTTLDKYGNWFTDFGKLDLSYFDNVYCPYTLVMGNEVDTFVTNNPDLLDLPSLNNSTNECGEKHKVLLMMALLEDEEPPEKVKILYDSTLCDFIKIPVTTSSGRLYYTDLDTERTEYYNGQWRPWKVSSNAFKLDQHTDVINNALNKRGFRCVNNFDLFMRIMYCIDKYTNIDFYFWCKGTLDLWDSWPEVGVKNNIDKVVWRLPTDNPGDVLMRRNLFLGLSPDVVQFGKSFAHEVCSGVFSLERA